jgi:xanthine dehydrogenase accessory factor
MASFAHLLGFRVIINDPGAERSSFPQAEQVIVEDFDLSETAIGANTYVVIATQHKNDHLWLQKALESKAAYVALIASHFRSKLILDYLAAQGVPADEISRIFAPAGFDLGAATPEEIALSVVSEIVALRRGKRALFPKDAAALDARAKAHRTPDKLITQCDL